MKSFENALGLDFRRFDEIHARSVRKVAKNESDELEFRDDECVRLFR